MLSDALSHLILEIGLRASLLFSLFPFTLAGNEIRNGEMTCPREHGQKHVGISMCMLLHQFCHLSTKLHPSVYMYIIFSNNHQNSDLFHSYHESHPVLAGL